VTAIYWVYGIGAAISLIVFRARSGLGFGLPRMDPTGISWLLVSGVKAFAWPLTLGIWLASGKPEPRILFGEKAERKNVERRR